MAPKTDNDETMPANVAPSENLRQRKPIVVSTKNSHSMNRVANEINALQPHIHPPVPNPAPLGLIAFGLTTALLQMRHTRWAGSDDLQGVDNLCLGFAMFFGGLLQVIAGVSEIKRNNIFGYTAFCLYGGFWMSWGTAEIVGLVAQVSVNPKASQAMLFMVGVYTFMLWILTFKLNKTICSLFFLLGTTCILLSFGVRNETVDIVGGYFGIATSINAFWLAFVELFNDVVGEGQEIIPLGHWKPRQAGRSLGVFHIPGRILGALHIPGRIHGTRPSTEQAPPEQHPDSLKENTDDNDDLEEGLHEQV